MRATITLLFSLCWFCLNVSHVSAQGASNGQFRNIVIGEGCASTCVNGHCEKTCAGSETIGAIEKIFTYTDFNRVMIKGVDVRIQYGQKYDIKLTHVPELINDIDVVVAGKTLTVSLPKDYKSGFKARLEITMPTLVFLRVEGNSNSSLLNFVLDKLEFQASDNVTISGAGNRLEQIVLQLDENADADFFASKVVSANVKVSDNATVKLSFADQAGAKLSGIVDGMADLLYCGNLDQSLVVSDMSDVSIISCD